MAEPSHQSPEGPETSLDHFEFEDIEEPSNVPTGWDQLTVPNVQLPLTLARIPWDEGWPETPLLSSPSDWVRVNNSRSGLNDC